MSAAYYAQAAPRSMPSTKRAAVPPWTPATRPSATSSSASSAAARSARFSSPLPPAREFFRLRFSWCVAPTPPQRRRLSVRGYESPFGCSWQTMRCPLYSRLVAVAPANPVACETDRAERRTARESFRFSGSRVCRASAAVLTLLGIALLPKIAGVLQEETPTVTPPVVPHRTRAMYQRREFG